MVSTLRQIRQVKCTRDRFLQVDVDELEVFILERSCDQFACIRPHVERGPRGR